MNAWIAPAAVPAPPSAQQVKHWRPGRWWAVAVAFGCFLCAAAYGFAAPIHDALQHLYASVAPW